MSDSHAKATAIVQREEPPQGMSPVVRAIMERNLEPSTVREILALQERYEANEAKKAFDAALVALKRDLPTVIARDKKVDYTSNKTGQRTFYTHASLAGVMDAITEPLTQHGFSLTWQPSTSQGQVSVTCRLAHSAGHAAETTISAPIDNSGNKNPAQGVSSTITLLQRYTALSLLGIATADMEEPKGSHEEAQPDMEKVDTGRNLRAVSRLKEYGRTREQAEAFLDKPVEEWTTADLKRLTDWAKASREPGSDG